MSLYKKKKRGTVAEMLVTEGDEAQRTKQSNAHAVTWAFTLTSLWIWNFDFSLAGCLANANFIPISFPRWDATNVKIIYGSWKLLFPAFDEELLKMLN